MDDIYFEQDGKDFYLYLSILAAECGDVKETVSAPFGVKDSDMESAENARAWFITEYCRANDLLPHSVFIDELALYEVSK